MLRFQIGVKKFTWNPDPVVVGEFSQYVTPTSEIPIPASNVNKLYRVKGRLVKITAGIHTELETVPIRSALRNMWEWLLEDCSRVILVGFNNANFDNQVLSHHSKIWCEPRLLGRVRSRVHCADLRNILGNQGFQGTLETNYTACNGPPLELHDALSDCTAVIHIMQTRAISRDQVMRAAVSMRSVLPETHPLILARLMTVNTTEKIGSITCEDYLRFSEKELVRFLKSKKVQKMAIINCLKRRRKCKAVLE